MQRVASDVERELALLRLPGALLPPLSLRDADAVREGERYLLTGFPIGGVLGLFAATRRAAFSAFSRVLRARSSTRRTATPNSK